MRGEPEAHLPTPSPSFLHFAEIPENCPIFLFSEIGFHYFPLDTKSSKTHNPHPAMTKDRQLIENLKTEAAKYGFTFESQDTTGHSHYRLTFTNAKGRTVRHVVPSSGQGHGRAHLNNRSELRRALSLCLTKR